MSHPAPLIPPMPTGPLGRSATTERSDAPDGPAPAPTLLEYPIQSVKLLVADLLEASHSEEHETAPPADKPAFVQPTDRSMALLDQLPLT